MAKKKKGHGKKKSKARRNPKRSRAAKRAYKKSGLYLYNKRRSKGGKKRKSYGKKSKGKSKRYVARKNKYSGSAVAARARFNTLVKRLEAKGYDKSTAVALAHRASRISSAMGRGSAKHKAAAAKAAAEAYMPQNYARHISYV